MKRVYLNLNLINLNRSLFPLFVIFDGFVLSLNLFRLLKFFIGQRLSFYQLSLQWLEHFLSFLFWGEHIFIVSSSFWFPWGDLFVCKSLLLLGRIVGVDWSKRLSFSRLPALTRIFFQQWFRRVYARMILNGVNGSCLHEMLN